MQRNLKLLKSALKIVRDHQIQSKNTERQRKQIVQDLSRRIVP